MQMKFLLWMYDFQQIAKALPSTLKWTKQDLAVRFLKINKKQKDWVDKLLHTLEYLCLRDCQLFYGHYQRCIWSEAKL